MLPRARIARLFHSLQLRLTLGFALVLALAVAGVSAYAAAQTRAETERFAREAEEARAQRVEKLVSEVYEATHNWDQVRYTIGQAARLLGWRVVIQDETGTVLADSHADSIDLTFDSGDFLRIDRRLPFPPRMYRRGLLIGNEELGMLMVVEQEAPRFSQWHPAFAPAGTSASVSTGTPVADIEVAVATPGVVPGLTEDEIAGQLAPEPRLDELESSFRRSLIMAGGAAGLAGILLVGMFTRQALAPVRGLTGAARRLGKGDLSYRVPENHHDEVGQLAKTFNEMAAGLETAAAQRKAMTADIAHELRTPLTNIKGYLEAIKDGVVEPDPATINVIYDQTVHLSRLVEDLRLLAIADAGRLRLDLQPERLDLLAEDAVTAFRPRATERRVALTVSAAAEVLPVVSLDGTRIRQVLANLVENALTHTPDGGRVTVSVGNAASGMVRLVVEDTGAGIPQELLERIFDQFYRVDPSRSRGTGGAGLGLTIVKRLVEAHGGTVRAESTPGAGSRFIVEIPVSPSTADT